MFCVFIYKTPNALLIPVIYQFLILAIVFSNDLLLMSLFPQVSKGSQSYKIRCVVFLTLIPLWFAPTLPSHNLAHLPSHQPCTCSLKVCESGHENNNFTSSLEPFFGIREHKMNSGSITLPCLKLYLQYTSCRVSSVCAEYQWCVFCL